MTPARIIGRAAAALVAVALALAGGASAARAGALLGVVPDIPTGAPLTHQRVARTANLPTGGGPVMHANRTHLVFWMPAGSGLAFDAGYGQQMVTFLTRVAHDSHLPTNVYSLTGQYTDRSGAAGYDQSYAGAILDTDPLPPPDPGCVEPPPPPAGTGPGWSDCVTNAQIESELSAVAATHGLPAGDRDVYFLITPNGLADCDTSSTPASCALGGSSDNGYCGYHSFTPGGLLYAVIPYNAVPGHCQSDDPRPNASTADPALSSLSHEHNETVTDPIGDAWIDSSFNENGDLCLDQAAHPPRALGGAGSARYDQVIDGGHYWLQLEWSNQEGGCAARDEGDPLSLRVPSAARTVTRITLLAHGRDPDGRIASYLWSLGDGATLRGGRVRHAYRRPGRYKVVVRSTDSAGNWAFASRTVTIRRPVLRHRRARRHR